MRRQETSISVKKKILVVDDEEVTTHLAKTFLERNGFDVVCAYDGAQALSLAKSEHPDLVLLDIMLPDIDGFEVCRRLKGDVMFRGMPILMFTAKGLSKDVQKGREVGADEYLIKPFSGKALVATIRKHLNMMQQ